MTTIGLLSDTHGFLDEQVFSHFTHCQEIWHAGDFGTGIFTPLMEWTTREKKILRGVYGNIDDQAIRQAFPEQLVFTCEKVNVLMRHIGGSPPRYNPPTRKALEENRPQVLICGHSHILKIMYDETYQCLFMNPGAAGRQGWHKIRTLVRFVVDGKELKDCEVIELGKR